MNSCYGEFLKPLSSNVVLKSSKVLLHNLRIETLCPIMWKVSPGWCFMKFTHKCLPGPYSLSLPVLPLHFAMAHTKARSMRNLDWPCIASKTPTHYFFTRQDSGPPNAVPCYTWAFILSYSVFLGTSSNVAAAVTAFLSSCTAFIAETIASFVHCLWWVKPLAILYAVMATVAQSGRNKMPKHILQSFYPPKSLNHSSWGKSTFNDLPLSLLAPQKDPFLGTKGAPGMAKAAKH